jgi:hypothetical protein
LGIKLNLPNPGYGQSQQAEQVFENVKHAENLTRDLHVWTKQRPLTTRPMVLVQIKILYNSKNCTTVPKVLYSTRTSPFWGQREGRVKFILLTNRWQ